MRYCGIDIASLSSFVYICDAEGKKILVREVKTAKSAFTEVLKPQLKGGLKIAIEAGNQTAWIYEYLVELGAEVTVVNPNKVKAIAESRRKTDKIDAKLLCELLRLNALPYPVHMPSQGSRELRGLLVARRQLIQARAKLCNVVRGMLRQDGIILPVRGLKTLKTWNGLLQATYKSSHLPLILKAYYSSFLALTHSLRQLDKELAVRGEADPRIELLKTMPLVGPVAALTLVAAIDDAWRFSSSRKLISYSGLAPTVRQSGERCEYGSISREGRSEIRAVWVQIAHLVAHSDKTPAQPLRRWFLRVAKRRGKKTALVALARRLLCVAFQMLKSGEVYDAKQLMKKAA
jgi:transposase